MQCFGPVFECRAFSAAVFFLPFLLKTCAWTARFF